MTDFRALITAALLAHEKTLPELIAQLETVSQATVYRYMRGELSIGADALAEIFDVLQIKIGNTNCPAGQKARYSVHYRLTGWARKPGDPPHTASSTWDVETANFNKAHVLAFDADADGELPPGANIRDGYEPAIGLGVHIELIGGPRPWSRTIYTKGA